MLPRGPSSRPNPCMACFGGRKGWRVGRVRGRGRSSLLSGSYGELVRFHEPLGQRRQESMGTFRGSPLPTRPSELVGETPFKENVLRWCPFTREASACDTGIEAGLPPDKPAMDRGGGRKRMELRPEPTAPATVAMALHPPPGCLTRPRSWNIGVNTTAQSCQNLLPTS